MPTCKSRFVTACQQLLALGVVLAVLTPAASVISLDVVRETPGGGFASVTDRRPPHGAASLSAYTRETTRTSVVPTEVVDPTVREVALTPVEGATARQRATVAANLESPQAAARISGTKASVVGPERSLTSVPQAVTGYGAVGVTWEHGTAIPEEGITVRVRTREDGTWSGWSDVAYEPEHGPDPGSAEAQQARPGTDPLLIGNVDDVQVQVSTSKPLPPALRLAVIDPGHTRAVEREAPALDTGAADAPASVTGSRAGSAAGSDAGSDAVALQAATFTAKPRIYSRAQWGADERLRDKPSLHYGEVHAGFVHHTVNANDYTRAQVPALLRGIYAYHTQSRGWSDIGYNFLVDRFGRIWEGRYGGVARPVVGAHTLNYNDYSFAASAIGNYETAQPSAAVVQAYAALYSWKLSLHGVSPSSTRQWVGSRFFSAINGHRDAAATACPGRYLYAKLPQIRRLAAAAQRGWSGRELESDLAGSAHPDLVVRRSSDHQLFVLPTGGLTSFAGRARSAAALPAGATVAASPDLTGDGRADLVLQDADGTVRIRPGTARGTFARPGATTYPTLSGHALLTPVGDVNGDDRGDLVGRVPGTGRLDLLLGTAKSGFRVRHLSTDVSGYQRFVGAGDVDGDGRDDLLARSGDRLWLYASTGRGFRDRVPVAGSWSTYPMVSGYGDFTGDGRDDLVARDSSGVGWVLPARGKARYGHRLGPLPGFVGKGTVVGAAQLVGDRTPDLVFRTGAKVSVLANRGTTELAAPIATGTVANDADLVLNAGDWDRDGKGDIITRNRSNGALFLRRGDGKGHFSTTIRIARGFANVRLLAAVGDMTGDGYPDLMGQPRGGSMRIYPGAGRAGLRASYVAHSAIAAGRQVAVGRWNADGAPDSLFRTKGRLTLYPGNGPGGLTAPKRLGIDVRRFDWLVGISDIGGTGHADVVARTKATGELWLLPGTTSGFGKPRFLGERMGGYDLAG